MREFPANKSVCLLLLSALLVCGGCSSGNRAPHEWSGLAMGTFFSIAVSAKDAERLSVLLPDVRREIESLEEKLSIFRADSDISAINRNAGEWTEISPETWQVLYLARDYAERSGGALDPTVAPLTAAWGFNGGEPPQQWMEPPELKPALVLTGWKKLELRKNAARLQTKGMQLDLGGVAKGFAVDRCFKLLQDGGITNVMINLGGNLRCHGGSGRNPYWIVGVRNPFDKNKIIGRMQLTGGEAMATSGNYEKFVQISGKNAAHIIDPRSGYPVEGMAGVTILAGTAVEADALSTALFVLGLNDGTKLLHELSGTEALFVPDQRPLQIWLTSGMMQRFTPEPEYINSIHSL